MRAISRITEDDNLVLLGIFEKPSSVMRDMAINKKEAVTAICFCFGLLVKIFDLLHTDLTIHPAFLQIADSNRVEKVSTFIIWTFFLISTNQDILRGLFCFQNVE